MSLIPNPDYSRTERRRRNRVKIIRGTHPDQVEREFTGWTDESPRAVTGTQTHLDGGEIMIIVFYEAVE